MDDDPGAIGFTAADPTRNAPLTLAFGQHLPAMGPLRGGPEDRVTFSLATMGAIEIGILDLLWLRDLPAGGPWTVRPTAVTLEAGSLDAGSMAQHPKIPSAIDADVVDDVALSGKLRELSPTYRQGLRLAAASLGRTPDEFEVFRVVVRYPTPRMNVIASRLLEQA